jgi:hypothetical protein
MTVLYYQQRTSLTRAISPPSHCPVQDPFTRCLLTYSLTIHFLSCQDKPSNTKLKLPNMSPFGKQPGCYREVGKACGFLCKRTRTFWFYRMSGIALRPENLLPTKKMFGSTVLVTANVWMIANIQCNSLDLKPTEIKTCVAMLVQNRCYFLKKKTC